MKKQIGHEPEMDGSVMTSPGQYAAQGIGAQLRAARQERGLSIEAVAAALRIKAHHIDSLERGDVTGMAGLTYALGYLRSYAAYLGYDGTAVVRQFKAEFDHVPANQPLVFPVPVKESKFPTGRVLAFSLILAVLAYGGYYYVSRSGKVTEAHSVPPVPAELADTVAAVAPPPETTPAPSHQPITPSAAYAASVGSEVPSMPTPPAGQAGNEQSLPLPGPGASTVPGTAATPASGEQQTASTPAAGTPAPVPGEGRVVLRASADAWVQIQSPGSEPIFTKILRAGETYAVPPRNDVTLVTGNAGALEILVDGKTTGPLGATGSVKRNISLDPEKLLATSVKAPI